MPKFYRDLAAQGSAGQACEPCGAARIDVLDRQLNHSGAPVSTAFDVIILGAGAAGLMCAMTAGARGRRVLLLDHAEAAGKKILISGGGRCNFTNRDTQAQRFLSENPHFARAALAGYTAQDFIALVDRHGIAWHEKTLGQLF